MIAAASIVAGLFFTLAFLLFLGGIVSAAREIRAEKRAGLPVDRPGWRRSPESLERERYRVPRGTGWVVWPLVMFGRADLAERYLVRRGGSVVQG